MDFTRAASFYDAPFPSEDLRKADGHIDLTKFPARDQALVIQQAAQLLESDARGFSSTAGVFMSTTAPLDATTLPDVFASTKDDASVFLLDVDAKKKIPVDVSFVFDGGPYGAVNELTILPYQGIPLRPSALHAAVVTSKVHDASGDALVPSSQMKSLLKGEAPTGVSAAAMGEMMTALDAVRGVIDAKDIVGVAVYRTDDPIAGMRAVVSSMLARPIPAPNAPLAPNEVFANFCVYSATIDMPSYQTGIPPYPAVGGEWTFDSHGPIFQRMETATIVVTLPQTPMPPSGFPTVVFSRTGAGGDRPLVDRGVQPATGQPATTPGTGPALELARAGFAGISIDGPLGGLRNPTNDPSQEDFLIFNISNPGAIRDNIRQSAAELALTAHILDALTIDANACPTLATASVKFDVGKLALMGHSMGATISPLTAALEPRFGAVVLSGCGGSFIENILYKQLPVVIRPFAELLIGYPPAGYHLSEGDPALSLVQWAAEAADPPPYGPLITQNVLMFQGIVDHYIMPPMANASTLSFGLDVAGPELDDQTPELTPYASVKSVLPLSGRRSIGLPAANNKGTVTQVVTQHTSDGIEDGHEIMFQTPGPKYQYRCFLASYAKGGAVTVPVSTDDDTLCPLP